MDLSADTGSGRSGDRTFILYDCSKGTDEEGFLIRAEQMESGEPGTGKLHLGELRSEELQSVQTWNGVTGYGI